MAYDVRKYVLNHFTGFHLFLGIIKTLKKLICKRKIERYLSRMENISGSQAPEPEEIMWENIGIKSHKKAINDGVIWLFTLISIFGCGFLVIVIADNVKKGAAYFFLFFFVLLFYTVIILILAVKRKGKTHTSNAYFILSRLTPF